mmetsp:Transcript_13879/g.32632  ORF Transcript_13879/g.32632 Transcript_13879/m.32632 type:complete len:522 (+) Transcript_13879:476-2041(+)
MRGHAAVRQHLLELRRVLLLDRVRDVDLKHQVSVALEVRHRLLRQASVRALRVALVLEVRLHLEHVDVGVWVDGAAVDVEAVEVAVQDPRRDVRQLTEVHELVQRIALEAVREQAPPKLHDHDGEVPHADDEEAHVHARRAVLEVALVGLGGGEVLVVEAGEEEEEEHEGEVDVGVALALHLAPLVGDQDAAPHAHVRVPGLVLAVLVLVVSVLQVQVPPLLLFLPVDEEDPHGALLVDQQRNLQHLAHHRDRDQHDVVFVRVLREDEDLDRGLQLEEDEPVAAHPEQEHEEEVADAPEEVDPDLQRLQRRRLVVHRRLHEELHDDQDREHHEQHHRDVPVEGRVARVGRPKRHLLVPQLLLLRPALHLARRHRRPHHLLVLDDELRRVHPQRLVHRRVALVRLQRDPQLHRLRPPHNLQVRPDPLAVRACLRVCRVRNNPAPDVVIQEEPAVQHNLVHRQLSFRANPELQVRVLQDPVRRVPIVSVVDDHHWNRVERGCLQNVAIAVMRIHDPQLIEMGL